MNAWYFKYTKNVNCSYIHSSNKKLVLFCCTCSVKTCLLNDFYYLQTGDTAKLPLLCHYPVKVCMFKHMLCFWNILVLVLLFIFSLINIDGCFTFGAIIFLPARSLINLLTECCLHKIWYNIFQILKQDQHLRKKTLNETTWIHDIIGCLINAVPIIIVGYVVPNLFVWQFINRFAIPFQPRTPYFQPFFFCFIFKYN